MTHLRTYVGLLHAAEQTLGDSYRQVAQGHHQEADVFHMCRQMAAQCDSHVAALQPIVDRYGEQREEEPERLHAEGLAATRSGGVGLLRDMQDLYMLASFVDITWTLIGQAARGARDRDVIDIVERCEQEITKQLAWLRTRLKVAAPQALLVAS
jgi:hypothetical protein